MQLTTCCAVLPSMRVCRRRRRRFRTDPALTEIGAIGAAECCSDLLKASRDGGRFCAVGEQQFPDVARRFRRAEQVTLHFGTTERAQYFPLLVCFDTLCRR